MGWGVGSQYGAGDRIRTDGILLGKQTLCQLSYTRMFLYYIRMSDCFQVGVNSTQYDSIGRINLHDNC